VAKILNAKSAEKIREGRGGGSGESQVSVQRGDANLRHRELGKVSRSAEAWGGGKIARFG
jgi:hypothetical protein